MFTHKFPVRFMQDIFIIYARQLREELLATLGVGLSQVFLICGLSSQTVKFILICLLSQMDKKRRSKEYYYGYHLMDLLSSKSAVIWIHYREFVDVFCANRTNRWYITCVALTALYLILQAQSVG